MDLCGPHGRSLSPLGPSHLPTSLWPRFARISAAPLLGAMLVGVGLSALTNGGIMFLAATGTNLIPAYLVGLAAATLGALVTGGPLMFTSMKSWDMKSRIQKAAKTRERNQALRAEEERRGKYTPIKDHTKTGNTKRT
jgi:hypothetical protein